MRKLLFFSYLCVILNHICYSQTTNGPLTPAQLMAILDDVATTDANYLIANYPKFRLASQYTFRNLVKNDFSTVTIADNTATVGQFAALSIDPNAYKLAFSPIAWSPQGKDLATKDFKNVFAINVTAALSNQSLLNLKDWRTVNGSFSYTHIMGDDYKFSTSTGQTKQTYLDPYLQIYKIQSCSTAPLR